MPVVPGTNPEEMQEALSIRRRVFIEEQGVPEDLEIDEYERRSGAGYDGAARARRSMAYAVATGRLLLESDDGQAAHRTRRCTGGACAASATAGR